MSGFVKALILVLVLVLVLGLFIKGGRGWIIGVGDEKPEYEDEGRARAG